MNDFGGGIRAERPLFEGADWEFSTVQRVHDAIEKIAVGELGLDVYPNQIEIIGTEQMLDAYSSIGMPLFYKHWSFGKHFARNEAMYRAGMQGLAYEIVINSNPCISYIMEENTATMQTLVIAHAAFGHNHFFKNNYVFKQWTDADGILDYLEFARGYIAHCEERYGEAQVERLLDAAHALMSHGVHRYPRRRVADLRSEEQRAKERRDHDEQVFNDLWRTVPGKDAEKTDRSLDERRRALLQLPQENMLYFLEKTAPRLQPWQREILRIVRMIAQYFYPQSADQADERGLRHLRALPDHEPAAREGAVDRRQHGRVPAFAHQRGVPAGLRRSALFRHQPLRARLRDDARHRAHLHRTDGRGPATGSPLSPAPPIRWRVLRDVWANYRDESFILQYPQPAADPQFGLFHVLDDANEPNLRVEAIHDERGYRKIQRALARQYDIAWTLPDIQVVDVNLAGDRRLILHHRALNRVLLEERDARFVLQHLADLWGYDVLLKEVDPGTDSVLKEHAATPRGGILQPDGS